MLSDKILRITLLSTGARGGTAGLGTHIRRAAGLNRNPAANRTGHAADFGFLDLTRRAGGSRRHPGLADLTAGRIGDATCPDFLGHAAGRVGNSLGDRFAGPRAGRVGNSLGDRLTGPRAGRVRDSFGEALLFVANAGVGDLLHAGDRHTAADRVGLLAMNDFLNHSRAADRSHFGTGHPAAAADRTIRLAASGAGARRPATRTGVLWADRSGNLLRFRDPIAGANLDLATFRDRLANRMADIAVAGFGFRLVGGAADFAALGFVDGPAGRAGDIAVAGLVARFADGAADIAIAGLVARLADRATDIAVARLEARFADCAADIAVAGLVARLADRVAFIAIAGFVNIPRAGHGNLLDALFIDGAAAGVGLWFPDGFANGLVTSATAPLGGAVGPAGCAGIRRAAFGAGRSTIEGIGVGAPGEGHQTRGEDHPGCVSH